jgi:ABC-type lipoprotein release transport system permease subunit
MTSVARLLAHLGFQSLRAHRTKSLIVGGLMAFGAFLVVTSLALLGSITRSTRASVVESIAGDVQVYSDDAEDSLALFGGIGLGTEDIGEIGDFAPIKAAIEGVDNVAGVVPMGTVNAAVSSPGDLDRALNALREAVASGDDNKQRLLSERVRTIAQVLLEQQSKQALVSDGQGSGGDVLRRATSDTLWSEFATDPVATLDWLDTQLAPLGEEGSQFYLRLLGVDLDAFRATFQRIKIVEGEHVPSGHRGVLVGKALLDRRLKNAVAMHLDTINNEITKGNRISDTKVQQETLAKARRAAPRLVYLLPPSEVEDVAARLATEVGAEGQKDLAQLLDLFLEIDDDNFARRYELFNEVIATRIQLYPFRVGDTITLTAFTKSGYLRSINVKVWGIYVIEGLESSDIASALSLSDLITFRELYGRRTAALDDELLAMKAESGAGDIAREDAEAAMFGGSDELAVQTVQSAGAQFEVERVVREEVFTFDPKKVQSGFALNLAVLLKDPSKASDSLEDISAAVAPFGQQAVGWQQATGIVGQITLVVSGILFGAIALLFLVTVVILNNSLVMATLERVSELGTLRAIGAQKRFVMAMVVLETAILGALAGVLGCAASVALVFYLGSVGIPAPAELLEVIFGGPRLYPTLTVADVLWGMTSTLVVGVFATLYPARLATRVQPVVAMQGQE